MREWMAGSLVAVVLLLGCGAGEKAEGLKPLRPCLDRLTAQGWKVEQDVTHGPYRAVKLFKNADDFERPYYRLILGVEKHGGQYLLPEPPWWKDRRGTFNYPFMGDCGFSDTLGTDGPVLYCERGTGGNGWTCSDVQLYELGPDGLHGISPELPERWVVHAIADVDGDGGDELMVLVCDYEFYRWHCHAASPGAFRIYCWDHRRRQFVDNSAGFREYYEQDIKRGRERLKAPPEDGDSGGYWSGEAISILLDYWCMGRARDGWQEFSALMERYKKHVPQERRAELAEMEADLQTRLGIDGPLPKYEQ